MKKIDNPETWKRMGMELCALHDLLVKIHCDPEYNRIMTKKIYDDRFYKINKLLDQIRSDAEDRMCELKIEGGNIDVFYPRTNGKVSNMIDKATEEYRKKWRNFNDEHQREMDGPME